MSETHLVHFHNSQVYEPTKYSDDVVYNSSRIENFNFNRLSNIYDVNKNTLTDQRSIYSIGFMSLNVEFYTVEQVTKDYADEGVVSEFIYQLGEYETVYTRNVYTFLDWYSSIGGLLGALEFIGSILMFISTLFSGSNLDRYLVANLFKTAPKKGDRKA